MNEAVIRAELAQAWEVLGEAIQTVMRRYAIESPYEKLKALTRGKGIDRDSLHQFIDTLEIPASEKTASRGPVTGGLYRQRSGSHRTNRVTTRAFSDSWSPSRISTIKFWVGPMI